METLCLRAIFGLIILVLSVQGCGTNERTPVQDGGSDPKSSPTVASGPGDYRFEFEGATGVISVPSSLTDPNVSKYEEYRIESNGAPVSYFVAHIDNTSGVENINMYSVVVVTEEGRQIEAHDPEDFITEWQESHEENVDHYNKGVDLSNSSMFFLRPGAKGVAVMVSEGTVPSVRRVFVYPAGGADQVEATKIG